MHRVTYPDDLSAFGSELLHDRGEHITNPSGAHPRNQRKPARDPRGVKPVDEGDHVVRRGGRADLQPDWVGQPADEVDMGAVDLPGTLPDPDEMGRQVVRPTGGRVYASQRTLI